MEARKKQDLNFEKTKLLNGSICASIELLVESLEGTGKRFILKPEHQVPVQRVILAQRIPQQMLIC